ncbi:34716_t:CDS:2, partial [Racocetra persica]
QQLKATGANKYAKHTNYENLDNYIWLNNNIDERASNYFAVLLIAGKTIYVGGSKRTQRYKKVELKKVIQNTQPITMYLAPILISSNIVLALTSTFGLSTELCILTKIKLIESELIEVKSIEMELVKSIEMKLVESMKIELVKLIEAELVESIETELVESIEIELVGLIEAELVKSMIAELIELTADILAKINEKTKIRLAIEELDGLLKTNNNQIDKGVRVHLQVSLQYYN